MDFQSYRVLDPLGTDSGNGIMGEDTAEFLLYLGCLQSEFSVFSGARPNGIVPRRETACARGKQCGQGVSNRPN